MRSWQDGDAGRIAAPSPNAAPRAAWWNRPRLVAGLTVIAVAAAVLAALTATGWNSQFDLRIYYDAVGFWRSGHDLYAYAQPDPIMGSLGFTYPPLAALVMTPMTWLSFGVVQVITLVAIVIAGALLVALILADSRSLPRAALWPGTLIATPVAFMIESMRENLSFGQINVFLGLLVVGDFLLLGRRYPRLAGLGAGLATALKVTPGIFLVYIALTRRWRMLLTALAAGALVTGIAAAVAPADTWHFFTVLLWDTSRVGRPESVLNQSVNGVLARIAAPAPPPRAVWAAAVAVVAVGGLARATRLYRSGDDLAGIAVTGLVGICISPISWMHHAVWVLPALAVLFDGWWLLRRDADRRRRRVVTAVLAVSGALCWGLQPTSYVRTPIDDWPTAAPFTVFLSALPVLWCLAAIALLPARGPARMPARCEAIG